MELSPLLVQCICCLMQLVSQVLQLKTCALQVVSEILQLKPGLSQCMVLLRAVGSCKFIRADAVVTLKE